MHCRKIEWSNPSSSAERFVTCTIGLKRDLRLNHIIMTQLTVKPQGKQKQSENPVLTQPVVPKILQYTAWKSKP